jgi:hypothetical protein
MKRMRLQGNVEGDVEIKEWCNVHHNYILRRNIILSGAKLLNAVWKILLPGKRLR